MAPVKCEFDCKYVVNKNLLKCIELSAKDLSVSTKFHRTNETKLHYIVCDTVPHGVDRL